MPIKILVVEDSEIVRKVIEITLSSLSYNVDIAINGLEAIRLFKKNDYDIVFMDLGLPDISGIEVTKELRRFEEVQNSIPIIALTAHHTKLDKELGLTAGIQEFVLKPLTKEMAQATINKYVEKNNLFT
ncbi:MAG TPA: response regulator [Candidatus Aquirickettsiella sp.]|jgi:CheY-like chemotaxis protein